MEAEQEPFPPSVPLSSLSLTHVQFQPRDPFAQQLAYVTLAPIAIIIAYVSVFAARREVSILLMFIGQLLCELLNAVLKRALKVKRPTDHLGEGYGMPSSHAQFMFYFATYAVWYVTHRITLHRRLWKTAIAAKLILFAALVAYSRVHLSYHSIEQVCVGATIGIGFGSAWYAFVHRVIRRTGIIPSIVRTRFARYFYIRDSYHIPDVMQFEYNNVIAETKKRLASKKKR